MTAQTQAVLKKPVVQAFVASAHKRSYPPEHNILSAGDEPRALYLILQGSVSVMVEDEGEGREMVLAYLNPGEFFGEMCLFPEQGVRTAIVRTRQPTLVAEVDFDAFLEFNRRYPDIMFEVAGQLATRLRETSRRLRDLTFLDVAARVAHALLDLTQQPDVTSNASGVQVHVSRQELARIVGCSREMSGRVLKKLEEDGLILCQGRNIIVPSTAALSGVRMQKPIDSDA